MKKIVLNILESSITTKKNCVENNIDRIIKAAELLAACLRQGHKVLIFGNGGSAADAQHLAAEFVNRFQIERPPLAAIALTTDSSILTSIGNDYNFNDVFSKQVGALGRRGDIAWGISTSGNSANVIHAIRAAQKIGLKTIGMTGRAGRLAECADIVFPVACDITARIQESHITVGHILCDLVDRTLYPDKFKD